MTFYYRRYTRDEHGNYRGLLPSTRTCGPSGGVAILSGTHHVTMNARCVVTSAEPRVALEQHPAALPEAIPRWAIAVHCDPGDLVMDPFMGCGTTCVAAARAGCRSVGVDKERGYWETAVRNMEAAQ